MKLSKKLTVAIIALIFMAISELTGLEIGNETIAGITSVVVTYLVSQGIVDKEKEKYHEDNI